METPCFVLVSIEDNEYGRYEQFHSVYSTKTLAENAVKKLHAANRYKYKEYNILDETLQ
jgi:hypothetical protein